MPDGRADGAAAGRTPSGAVVIDRLTAADTRRCAELETILFAGDAPWPAAAFTTELAQPHVRFFAARDGAGALIGYAGIALLGSRIAPESEVHTIGVDPARQGLGIGSALLATLLEAADAHGGYVFLEVRTDNATARALYERNGFAVVGRRKNYYRPSGADAYTMKRPPAPKGRARK